MTYPERLPRTGTYLMCLPDHFAEATAMAQKVRAAGFGPVPVEVSELKRGGGSVKCPVAELRS